MARMTLSIDGGGTRLYYFAKFLRAVEERLDRPLVEHFDLIVGNSAGGIVALAMANGMPLLEIADMARRVLPEIFTRGWLEKVTNPGGLRRPMYDNRALVRELDALFGDAPMAWLPIPTIVTAVEVHPDAALGGRKYWMTRIIDGMMDAGMDVVDYTLDTVAKYGLIQHHRAAPPEHRSTYVIKSWKSPFTVKEAAIATSAAPTYLPGIVKGNKGYIDGGLAMNNPALVAASEALRTLPESVTPYLFSVGAPDLDIKMDDASDEAFSLMDEYLMSDNGQTIAQKMADDIREALADPDPIQ